MYQTINELLESYNITNLHFVSDVTGIPYRTLQNWVNGYRKPKSYIVGLIQARLDIKLNELTGRYILEQDPTIFNQMR